MPEGDRMQFITVRVGKVPGEIKDIALDGGRTVSDALSGAGLNSAGFEIRINGVIGNTSTELHNGDSVVLVKKIAGN